MCRICRISSVLGTRCRQRHRDPGPIARAGGSDAARRSPRSKRRCISASTARWRAFVKPGATIAGDVVRFGRRQGLFRQLMRRLRPGRGREATLALPSWACARRGGERAGEMPLPPLLPPGAVRMSATASTIRRCLRNRKVRSQPPRQGCNTDALIARLGAWRVVHRVTLHVGAGTFLPVGAADTAEHRTHTEQGA
jgi:S-adenosylmethionine:tRNA ribosyltransferase-isomerase